MIQVRKFDYNELNVILDQVFLWKEDLIAADTSQFDFIDLLEELSVAECYADKKDNVRFQKMLRTSLNICYYIAIKKMPDFDRFVQQFCTPSIN